VSADEDETENDGDGEKTVFQAPTGTPTPVPSDETDAVEPDAEGAGEVDEEEDDGRTVIRPGPAPSAPAEDAEEDERTVIAPAARSPADDEAAMDRTIIDPGAGRAETPPAPRPAPPPSGGNAPPKLLSGISIGQVLNHTYEVKRFIARGGMGEVFEGFNVTNEQRVAIKVILPSLASDPAVIEMFVKEATVLERLVHPALVNYRTQARDPDAGVFYIVTNFIEGNSLESLIGKVQPSDAEIISMARRLAEGLGAAHSLGAIHRDIAPDNILLEGGDLDRAQIIDFGIARDIDPGSKTVIGTGFAGKLSFVAPEQLGAFEGDVGPWTDVYSLGLVLLGLAQGETLKLGKSMFEAIEKRKEGVDTSRAPPGLRPLFDAMLTYDPAQRLRSMKDVVAMLDQLAAGEEVGTAAGGHGSGRGGGGSIPRPALIGGGALLGVLLLAGLGYIAFGGGAPDGAGTQGGAGAGMANALDAQTARQRAEAALANLDCHWLDLSVSGTPGALVLAADGVAGQPAAIEPAVFDALQGAGVSTNFSGVEPLAPGNCQYIDALRPFRVPDSGVLTQSQRQSELERFAADYPEPDLAGKLGARFTFELRLEDTAQVGLMFLGEEEITFQASDQLQAVLPPRYRQAPGNYVVDAGWQLDGESWVAIVVLEGGNDVAGATAAFAAADYARFNEIASSSGLRAHVVWHHFVDEAPNS